MECTLTADFFTQMRSTMNVQRALVNQMVLEQGTFDPPEQWPTPAPGTPALLTTRDVLRYATINGAKALRLDHKTGSLTPGKEADIIILDATAINVAPLNQVPGAVVSLMERSNVETVIVAGKVRKWKGRLLDINLSQLRRQLEDSRDYLFSAAGIPQNSVPALQDTGAAAALVSGDAPRSTTVASQGGWRGDSGLRAGAARDRAGRRPRRRGRARRPCA